MNDPAPENLIVQQLCKEYPTPAEPLVVLRDIEMELHQGESLAVLGPSGSGKSTLLHLIGTLDAPSSGKIQLGGVDPSSLEQQALALYRNQKIGFVFQEHYLLPQCTLLENVLLPTLALGKPQANDIGRAQDLLDRVGLADRQGHHPGECSGGE